MDPRTSDDFPLMSDPVVAAVRVDECGEQLVDLRGRTELDVDGRKADPQGAFAHLRLSVAQRLIDATQRLPQGYRLKLVEGYRPPTLQAAYFQEYVDELTALHPTWSGGEIHAAASRYVSPPDIAPHCAGAAIDVALTDGAGEDMNMGSVINASPEDSGGACYTGALVSPEARNNRNILVQALVSAGFVNYPTEWWHWSYGDRYWALIMSRRVALYGDINLNNKN